MRQCLAVALALLLVHPAFGAAPEVVTTSWNGLRARLGDHKTTGKRFEVRLKDGKKFKAILIAIRDDAWRLTTSACYLSTPFRG